jgi:tRNA A37 methylthiotransferase MiaB
MPRVPPAEVARRAAALRAEAARLLRAHLDARVGAGLDVLVEADGLGGHAADFTRVRLDAPAPRGTLLRARAVAAARDHLLATRS